MSYNISFMGLGKLRRDQHAATLSSDHRVIIQSIAGTTLVDKMIVLEDRDQRRGYDFGSCSDVYRISSYWRIQCLSQDKGNLT